MDAFWQIDGEDLLIFIKAKPGATRDAVTGTMTDARGRCHLEVSINAPATDSKANKRLCRLISRSLQRPPTSCSIERGQSSRLKTLRLIGAAGQAAIAARLG